MGRGSGGNNICDPGGIAEPSEEWIVPGIEVDDCVIFLFCLEYELA